MQPVTGRRACDGPSHRSSQSSEAQYFHQGSVTVCHTCDGLSCHFVTKFRESIFSTQFSVFLSVLKRYTLDGPSFPWRSVVSACFSRNKICCSKRLKRALQCIDYEFLECELWLWTLNNMFLIKVRLMHILNGFDCIASILSTIDCANLYLFHFLLWLGSD